MRITGVFALVLLLAPSSDLAAQGTINVQGGVQGIPPSPSQPGQTTPAPPGNPQRMPARPLRPGEAPPKGTAVIKGRVTAGGTGAAVRRAQVRAQSMDARGGGVTSTDNNGQFEIKDLPAGRYTITVSKGGFAPAQFGQRRAGDPGTPIELVDGQTADKVTFVLARGGVIAGTVVDDGGEPVAGAQVGALRYQWMSGTRRLVPAFGDGSTDRTDDRGGFRLFGLPPGEYYLNAANRNNQFTMAGMSNTESDGFAPTYFPGTPNVSEATRITLKAGQEVSGANFALIVARMARVRGRVVNSRGEPASGLMAMLAPNDPFGGAMMMNMSNAMLGADGSFEFTNVAPGRYNINIRSAGGMQTPNSEFAVMPLTVSNDDIDNLLVATHAGATLRGVVTTDDGQVPPFRPDQVQIFAQMLEPTAMFVQPGQNRMQDDYSFEMTGLFDRRRLFATLAQGLAGGWFLKSVLYDGQDITDTGLEFTPGRTVEGVTVVFSQKATDLSGVVTDDRNQPVLDATVVVFPANRERWTFQSRYIRAMRPDTNGRYNTRNLPPGEDYLVIAVQNLEQGQGSDPEFLARAREEAKPFLLAEGETKAVDVKLSAIVP
jgi:hypothetical protein